MFCGFCEQPCDDSLFLERIEVEYCGQKGKTKTTFYCDKACVFAKIRQVMEPQYRLMIQQINEFPIVNLSKKETFTYILALNSLLEFITGCLERKSLQELKIRLRDTKRLFQEVFVYQTHIDIFSQWNAAFLDDDTTDAWAK